VGKYYNPEKEREGGWERGGIRTGWQRVQINNKKNGGGGGPNIKKKKGREKIEEKYVGSGITNSPGT